MDRDSCTKKQHNYIKLKLNKLQNNLQKHIHYTQGAHKINLQFVVTLEGAHKLRLLRDNVQVDKHWSNVQQKTIINSHVEVQCYTVTKMNKCAPSGRETSYHL